jgi:hypothetical protein
MVDNDGWQTILKKRANFVPKGKKSQKTVPEQLHVTSRPATKAGQLSLIIPNVSTPKAFASRHWGQCWFPRHSFSDGGSP